MSVEALRANFDTPEIIEPPFNYEAEQALLGAILVNNLAYGNVAGWLKPEHFADPDHAEIFRMCGKLIGEGRVADPITLRHDKFENNGSYLAQLAASAVTIINAKDYGLTIFECWQYRESITIAEDLTRNAMDSEAGGAELIEATVSDLQNLLEGPTQGNSGTLGSYAQASLEASEVAYKNDGAFTGIATGIGDLDNVLGGLQPGDLIVVAGRTSMGKTTLACNIAHNVAQPNGPVDIDTGDQPKGNHVGFETFEQDGEQIAQIILAKYTRIPTDKQRRGDLDTNDWGRLSKAKADFDKLPFNISCVPKSTVEAIANRARRLKKSGKLDLLIIDYLQLIRPVNPKAIRVEQVTQITQDLKALARELQVPVIALAQLSRAVEQRDDKRPKMSDLRESGSIEQDADVVILIYRHEYYLNQMNPEPGSQEHAAWEQQLEKHRNVFEMNIAKNKMGRTERVTSFYQASESRVENLERG